MADEESGELSDQPPKKNRFHWCLSFCWLLNVVTGLSAMLCLVAHAIALVAIPDSNKKLKSFTEQSLRLFGILFSMVVASVETEWQFVLRNLQLLEAFIPRALLQMFLSVLTLHATSLEEVHVSKKGLNDLQKSVLLYGRISGFTLLGCSALYFLGGIVCCGALKRLHQKRLHARSRLERELQATQKQEKELKGLLATYSGE